MIDLDKYFAIFINYRAYFLIKSVKRPHSIINFFRKFFWKKRKKSIIISVKQKFNNCLTEKIIPEQKNYFRNYIRKNKID